MKEERDQIKINNPDGLDRAGYEDGGRRFLNDSSNFIREHSLQHIREAEAPREHFISAAAENVGKGRGRGRATSLADNANSGTGSPSPASTPTAKTTEAATRSIATALGGGVTAITGVVAATVVTAVIVVTTFLAVLGVNLSLVMADYTSLTFRLELVTEGEGELEDPYYQAIISGNGVSQELTVLPGDFFTFEGLEPDKEYLVTIKNGGEIKVEQSFCTAARPVEKGSLEVFVSDGVVTCFVSGVSLRSDEFYTVTVTNEKGAVLFATDDVESEKTFTFRLSSPTKIKATLSVGGKVQAIGETEWSAAPEPEPEPILPDYDFESAAWQWAQDYSAVLSVPDKNGGEALTVDATITQTKTPATCEVDGAIVYDAIATYGDRTFRDSKTAVLTAFGHDYVFESFVWTPVYPSDDDVNISDGHGYVGAGSDDPVISDEGGVVEDLPIIGYTVMARFVCAHDSEHVLTTADGVTVTFTDSAASCEADVVRTYVALLSYQGSSYRDSKELVLEGTALGHEYAFDRFVWTPVYSSDEGNVTSGAPTIVGYTAVARLVCSHDSEHVLTLTEDVEVTYVDTPAECEEDAFRTYTASFTYGGVTHTDDMVQTFEETAHGHDFSEAGEVFDWGTDQNGAATSALRIYCSYGCGEYVHEAAEVYMEGGDLPGLCEEGADVTYYAYVMFRDNLYEATKEVENLVLGHDYGEPVFEWNSPDGSNYYVTAYFVCSRCLDHTVTVQSSQAISQGLSDGGRIYTATVTFGDETYWARKETHPKQGSSKAPAVGVNYKVGDCIYLNNSAYFKEGDDSADAVTMVYYSGSTVILSFDITLDEDYSITVKDYQTGEVTQSLYRWENGARDGNVSGWSVWFSEIYQGDEVRAPVGITIVSGSGTAADPFVLAPLYGKTVTFDYSNGESSTLYYTEDEVAEGVYAVPPTNDPRMSPYVFNGWMLDGERYDFGEEVTDNITLTPLWALVAETVSVYFMVDGDVYEVQEIIKNGCAARPVAPEREGVTAVGWYVDDETVLYDFTSPVEDTLFLYVKWEPSA